MDDSKIHTKFFHITKSDSKHIYKLPKSLEKSYVEQMKKYKYLSNYKIKWLYKDAKKISDTMNTILLITYAIDKDVYTCVSTAKIEIDKKNILVTYYMFSQIQCIVEKASVKKILNYCYLQRIQIAICIFWKF